MNVIFRIWDKLTAWSDRHTLLGYWLPVLLVAGFIFYLSSQSSPPTPPQELKELIPYWRKFAHMLLYTALAVLFYRAASRSSFFNLQKNAYALTLLFTAWYGTFDELHQHFVPYRVAHYIDIIVDILGGLLGVAIVYLLKQAVNRQF